MSDETKIEWCDSTFNPWTGCSKVSPACDHCYAEGWAKRSGMVQWGPGAPRRRTSVANWRKPLAWNRDAGEFYAQHGRRRRVFCASLADVFDNAVPDAWRMDLFKLIADTPNLDWLILTKRIGNVRRYMQRDGQAFDLICDGRVWLGATICNQEEASRDIPKLLDTPAAVRFLSMEPLLGPVDLRVIDLDGHSEIYPLKGTTNCEDDDGKAAPDLPALDWVIVGGESGPGARPMHPDWARSLRDQCKAAGVPYLFKQWGEWTPEDWGERAGYKDTAGVLPSGQHSLMSQGYVPPFDSGDRLKAANNVRLDGRTLMDRVGKQAAGRQLDGAQHDGFPSSAALNRAMVDAPTHQPESGK